MGPPEGKRISTDTQSERSAFHQLLVLGMHRSGTSAIAGLLHACGVYVGSPDELLPAAPDNPKGFFERRDAHDVFNALLRSAGAEWWRIREFDLDRIPPAALREGADELRRLISELDLHGTWLLKEPRLCLLLPLVRPHLRRPVAVIAVRHPVEVMESLRRRNGFPRVAALALWEAYVLAILRNSAEVPRLFVSYADLVGDPVRTTESLKRELDALGVAGLRQPRDAFVDPSLQREHIFDATLETVLSEEQRQLWRCLSEGAAPPPLVLSTAARVILEDFESDRMADRRRRRKFVPLARLKAAESALMEAEGKLREHPAASSRPFTQQPLPGAPAVSRSAAGGEQEAPSKPSLHLMPAVRRDGKTPTGSGWVRVLVPYMSREVQRRYRVDASFGAGLPDPGASDVVLIQRDIRDADIGSVAAWLDNWRSAGGKFIYETDDDLMDGDALRARGYSGDIDSMVRRVRWLASNADVVTVSTAHLGEKICPFSRHIHVVPNYLESELWGLGSAEDDPRAALARRTTGPVRIVYIGTPTHDEDLAIVAEAMNAIQAKYGERVDIEIVGAFQKRQPSFGRRVDAQRANTYPDFVNWLRGRASWDIGIIPLADSEFNRSKSNVKFLEYAALGLAIVCSDVENYRSVARDGDTAIIVKNSFGAWFYAVADLIENAAKRHLIAANARALVSSAYTLDANSETYLSMLRRACTESSRMR